LLGAAGDGGVVGAVDDGCRLDLLLGLLLGGLVVGAAVFNLDGVDVAQKNLNSG
jgi:hypothetical protein